MSDVAQISHHDRWDAGYVSRDFVLVKKLAQTLEQETDANTPIFMIFNYL